MATQAEVKTDGDVPMIAYFMGVPLSEIPREELERQFCLAHAKIERLQRENCDRSIAHVHDLAAAARRLASAKASPLVRTLSRGRHMGTEIEVNPLSPELRRLNAIAALDAGLAELERQGAVKLPRYCKRTGRMLGNAKCECCE